MSKFTAVTRAVGKASLQMKKTSPTVLFAVGIGGVVVGTVLACRATLKVEDVLEAKIGELEDVNAMRDDEIKHSDYTTQDAIKDKSIVYVDLVVELTKLYGPAVVIGGIGIACLTGSHRILTKRNAALTMAYAALERSYNTYREHVRDAIGEDREKELHYEVQTKLARQDEDLLKLAKKKPPKKDYSVYAKFFDEANPNWTRSAEQNMGFLHCQQDWANQMLRARGFILLNDVYDMLGIPRTTAGCVVGWTMYEDGDNYVDFGIFNHHTDEVLAFVNGIEKSVLLDFNVDGIIYDKIER